MSLVKKQRNNESLELQEEHILQQFKSLGFLPSDEMVNLFVNSD